MKVAKGSEHHKDLGVLSILEDFYILFHFCPAAAALHQQQHQLLDLRSRASLAEMIDGGFCKPTLDDYLNLILMMMIKMIMMTKTMTTMMTTMTTMMMKIMVVSAMTMAIVIVIIVMQLRTIIRIDLG